MSSLDSASLLDLVGLPADGPLSLKIGVLLVAALGALCVVKLVRFFLDFGRISKMLSPIPAAPGCNWLLGHVFPLIACAKEQRGPWDLMEDWLNKVGPIVKFRILNTQGVIVRDPQALKRAFQTKFKTYEKDLDLSYGPFLPILGTGLVTANGEQWQKQRLLIGYALRVEILDSIIDIAKRAVDRLSLKLMKVRGTGQAIDIEEEFRLLKLQVIGEAVLSLPPEECDRVFPQLYLPVMQEANHRVLRPYRRYLPTPDWFKFRSRVNTLNTYLINLFRQRWQARLAGEPHKNDILGRVMEGIEKEGVKWDSALETQLCYDVKTFLLAGHETSASMLTWSVYELMRNKEAREKTLEEAHRVWGSSPDLDLAERLPERREVDNMTWTFSVLKEALRKYSVVPTVTRKLAQDDELLGYKIPAGTMIVLHIQGTHNMYQEPSAFRPERFMPGGEYEQFEEGDRTYMFCPFIQGPRNCLGQHFAMLEARVVLSLLLKRFTFKPASPEPKMRHPTVIPVAPLGGLKVLVE